MKGMIKDALILFAITLVAGLLLGVVNEVTKEPIYISVISAYYNKICKLSFSETIILVGIWKLLYMQIPDIYLKNFNFRKSGVRARNEHF